MNSETRAWALPAAGMLLSAVLLSGCGDSEEAVIGSEQSPEAGEVTLVSDENRETVEALCVSDIPEDLTTCPGAPDNLGQLQLDETRKATLVVPQEVAESGYRVRVNGDPLPQHDGVLNEQSLPIDVPAEALAGPGETVLTIEALFSRNHPRAVWQFLLEPPGR